MPRRKSSEKKEIRDYRHSGKTRKNNPPAKIAAEGVVPLVPKVQYTYGPRRSPALGFEETLWQTADKMRGHMDPSEYKHVALGLIFVKYITDVLEDRRKEIGKQATYKVHGGSSRSIRGSEADME